MLTYFKKNMFTCAICMCQGQCTRNGHVTLGCCSNSYHTLCMQELVLCSAPLCPLCRAQIPPRTVSALEETAPRELVHRVLHNAVWALAERALQEHAEILRLQEEFWTEERA